MNRLMLVLVGSGQYSGFKTQQARLNLLSQGSKEIYSDALASMVKQT